MSGVVDPVKAACEANYAAHINDCSGFAKAVSASLRVPLVGSRRHRKETLRAGGDWVPVAGRIAAEAAAQLGRNQTLNNAWIVQDHDNISYASHVLP